MNKIIVTMSISLVTNIFLSLIKIVSGILCNSGALIADGIHSFSDLVTDLVAIIGDKISRKPADYKHPFGHGKLEYLTSFFIGVIILVLGLSIISNSFKKEFVIPSIAVAIVSFFTIVIKFLLATFLISKGKKYNNNILVASGKESSTDVLSSVVVLLSALISQFSNQISAFKYADLVATIIVGIFIVRVGFEIVRDNISILIGECETNEEFIENLTNVILKNKSIIKVDSINLIKYGSYYKLNCEVSLDGKLSFKVAHNIVHILEDSITNNIPEIKYITIHANPYDIV